MVLDPRYKCTEVVVNDTRYASNTFSGDALAVQCLLSSSLELVAGYVKYKVILPFSGRNHIVYVHHRLLICPMQHQMQENTYCVCETTVYSLSSQTRK